MNPTKRRPNLKMQQTTVGTLKGAGEMLVDYDRCAVLVISSTYRNHAMTIHDADTTEISPYYVHNRPLSDLFEIRKKCMGTLHLSTR